MIESMTHGPAGKRGSGSGENPDAVLADLAATYPQANAQQSISDLTGGDMEQAAVVLAQVFAAQASE